MGLPAQHLLPYSYSTKPVANNTGMQEGWRAAGGASRAAQYRPPCQLPKVQVLISGSPQG